MIPQVSWDDRPVVAKRRRAELYGFLEHLGIQYPPGAPKETMLKLLEANNINLNVPHEYFQWEVSLQKDENGNDHQHIEPVFIPHESARQAAEGKLIDYERIMREKTREVEQAREATEEQQKANLTLLDRIAALERKSLPLSSMTPFQLKKICKQNNIDITGLTTKAELLNALGE